MTKQALKTGPSSVRLGAGRLYFLRTLAFCALLGIFVAFHTTSDASEASGQSGRRGHGESFLSYLSGLFNAIRLPFQATGLEAQEERETSSELDEEEEKKRKLEKYLEENANYEEEAKNELEEARKEEERNREARRKNRERRKEREARRKEEEEERIKSGYYEKKYGGIHHKNALREKVTRQIKEEREEREARRKEEEEERLRSGYYEKLMEKYPRHARRCCGRGCLIRRLTDEEEEKIYNEIYEGKRELIGEEEIREEAFDRALKRDNFEEIEENYRYVDEKDAPEELRERIMIMRGIAAERNEREAKRNEEEQERIKSGYYEKKYGKEFGMYHRNAIKERILRGIIAKQEEENIYDAIYEGRRPPIAEEEIKKEAFHNAYYSYFVQLEPHYDEHKGYKYIDYNYLNYFRPES